MDYQRGYYYDEDLEKEEVARGRSRSGDSRSTTKRGTPYTRGTAMSFGFRRRPTSGIPMPVNGSFSSEISEEVSHPRSKSAGHEQDRRRDDDNNRGQRNAASGRSTPRLAPPKKESAGISVRTNRFGFRQPQPTRYTDKVGDVCVSHNGSNYNSHDRTNDNYSQSKMQSNARRVYTTSINPTGTKLRPSPVNTPYNNNNLLSNETGHRSSSYIPEPISKYTLHTSHLPQPQFAVRMNESNNTKTAKTAANQSRKISTVSKCTSSSKEGSGTEDSGVGSQFGCLADDSRNVDYLDNSSPTIDRRGGNSAGDRHGRPRNLRMVVNGKSFDVRDVHDGGTVTEISVITLPKLFGNCNLNTGLVRERTSQYQRVINKDNRYNDSISVTSSEGYDEGLGEEKVYKDRSRYEKVPSVKSDFSPPSSDDPEYGHGEAMADEYSFSSSDECRANYNSSSPLKSVSSTNVALPKNGTLPKTNLRSVLLTIEDPAFAAAAATSTTLIDDETSPVDSLFDSPTASITQSDGKPTKKDNNMEKSGNTIEDDSPGTPTNASNSLSLSEGREFFDDEIADQPGLTFDDTLRVGHDTKQKTIPNQVNENSYTLVESHPKTTTRLQGKSVENSPMHGRRLSHAGSVDTLSPCESIASDDLMLDYERSDASSYEESTHRLDSNPALHELDDATILSELEAQGEEVMREWSSLLGAHHPIQQSHSNNTNNNNVNANNNNNHNAMMDTTAESGIGSGRTSRLLRSRSGTDSPRSLDSVRTRQVSSPLRPPRNIQSPSLDSGDEGSMRLERGTYQYMFQDIVSIKTMLLKLKRVLQESEENGLTRAETLNPFDNSMKNGLFYNLNESGTTDASTSPGSGGNSVADELADLRRQVVFMQGQIEDKDRTIHLLQVQMTRYEGINGLDSQCGSTSSSCNINDIGKGTCNAATQTDKVRPVSAGPSLLRSLPQDGNVGPLVSWSDLWNEPHPPTPAVLNAFRTLRKPSDHSPRLLKSRQDQALRNDYIEKPLAESSPMKKLQKSKDSVQNRSSDLNNSSLKEAQNKPETTSPKSSIPMPRRLTQQTLIPRAARAVSATGRSHNL